MHWEKVFQPKLLESLYVGCVGLSQQYFADGLLTREHFQAARTAAQLELRPIAERFRRLGWERAAGASGTIRAVSAVISESEFAQDKISRDELEALIELLIDCGETNSLKLPGLAPERAPVFPGGVAILAELLNVFQIDELLVTQGALREGVLYDLLGRLGDEDSRLRTVRAIQRRYHIDFDQADRVELTALALFDQVAITWNLDKSSDRLMLGWAARLHEIGLDIAHSQHHRHGAYLLQHADLPGFHRDEQRMLACLVGTHRRKFSIAYIKAHAPDESAETAARLAVLLRLAALFNRSRTYEFPDALTVRAVTNQIELSLTRNWLKQNPLTLADLELEKEYLAAAKFDLQLKIAETF